MGNPEAERCSYEFREVTGGCRKPPGHPGPHVSRIYMTCSTAQNEPERLSVGSITVDVAAQPKPGIYDVMELQAAALRVERAGGRPGRTTPRDVPHASGGSFGRLVATISAKAGAAKFGGDEAELLPDELETREDVETLRRYCAVLLKLIPTPTVRLAVEVLIRDTTGFEQSIEQFAAAASDRGATE